MKIDKARKLTGFEKSDFDAYDDKCSCGRVQNRHNSENYKRTSFEYDEGIYACNKCVIEIAYAMKRDPNIIIA